jgi:hypothetical protein
VVAPAVAAAMDDDIRAAARERIAIVISSSGPS